MWWNIGATELSSFKISRFVAFSYTGNITVTVPNYTAAAYDFIRAFRKGELGQVMLDWPETPSEHNKTVQYLTPAKSPVEVCSDAVFFLVLCK